MNGMPVVVQSIAAIITSVCSVGLMIIAWKALKEWKKEHIGIKQHDIAEDVLTQFYNARAALDAIRSGLSLKDEGKTRVRKESEYPGESERLDKAYIVKERYLKNKETFDRLFALRFRFMAAFGEDCNVYFQNVTDIIHDIFRASDQLGLKVWKLEDEPPSWTNEGDYQKFREEKDKLEKIIWKMTDEKDEIEERMNFNIEKIEEMYRKVMVAKA